jgi:hypothetical protein
MFPNGYNNQYIAVHGSIDVLNEGVEQESDRSTHAPASLPEQARGNILFLRLQQALGRALALARRSA